MVTDRNDQIDPEKGPSAGVTASQITSGQKGAPRPYIQDGPLRRVGLPIVRVEAFFKTAYAYDRKPVIPEALARQIDAPAPVLDERLPGITDRGLQFLSALHQRGANPRLTPDILLALNEEGPPP